MKLSLILKGAIFTSTKYVALYLPSFNGTPKGSCRFSSHGNGYGTGYPPPRWFQRWLSRKTSQGPPLSSYSQPTQAEIIEPTAISTKGPLKRSDVRATPIVSIHTTNHTLYWYIEPHTQKREWSRNFRSRTSKILPDLLLLVVIHNITLL